VIKEGGRGGRWYVTLLILGTSSKCEFFRVDVESLTSLGKGPIGLTQVTQHLEKPS